MKLRFGDSIRVTWVDACGGGGGWKAPMTDGVTVVNTAVFVRRNKNGLCLAAGVDPKDKELVLEPSFIPAGMIRRIQKLR